MTGRYRTDDHNDLISRIKMLERRLSILERTPQTFRAGINSGTVTFQGGSITFLEDVTPPTDQDPGSIHIGYETAIDGETAMGFVMSRNYTVPSDEVFFGTTETITAQQMLMFRTREGAGSNKFPTWELYDKNGDPLITDTYNARRGFSDPRLSYAWNTATFATSTSATFAEIANTEWYMYHPHLRIRVLVQNDVGSASEILVIDQSTGINAALLTKPVASGTVAYVDVIIARSLTANGKTPNGNTALIRIDHRRSSGAGTIRTRIVSIVGLDLSLFEPY